jgi:hypothetical protein
MRRQVLVSGGKERKQLSKIAKVRVGVEASRRKPSKESIKEGRPQRLNEGILPVGRRRRRGRVGERAVRCEGEVKRASSMVTSTDRFVWLTGWRVGTGPIVRFRCRNTSLQPLRPLRPHFSPSGS